MSVWTFSVSQSALGEFSHKGTHLAMMYAHAHVLGCKNCWILAFDVSSDVLTDIFKPLNIFALGPISVKIFGCVTFFVNFNFRSAELFLPQWRRGRVWDGETLRKLIEKHWKRYNLSIGNYVINFLFPIIEIAEENNQQFVQLLYLKKHGQLRDPRLPQRRIDARGDWRNCKKYPKFVWSHLVWSGQNLTWHLAKPKTLFGKRHGLGRFLEGTLPW